MKEGRLERRCAFVEGPRTDLHRRAHSRADSEGAEHSGAQRSNGLIVIQHTQMKEAIHGERGGREGGGCGRTDGRADGRTDGRTFASI